MYARMATLDIVQVYYDPSAMRMAPQLDKQTPEHVSMTNHPYNQNSASTSFLGRCIVDADIDHFTC